MADSLIMGSTSSSILYELRKINETLSKTKEEHTLNLRMIKPTEKFNFCEAILNTTKLGLIRLSVYDSVFNITERNNQFIFTNPQSFHQIDASKIFIIPPGSYELTDMADIIKQETNNNIIQLDKNTMKCKIVVKQGVINFDVENSVASLLGFDNEIYSRVKYTTNIIIDLMGFNTINFHCNIISGAKDNGEDTDVLYTFNLTEPPGYLINIIPTNILYQNVTKDRIEYIEFHIKDEYGRPIDFNGDVLNFTLHLC